MAARAKKPQQRFRLVSDNDGHDYVIPVEKTDEFYKWLDDEERSSYDECDKYNEYRTELFTFTDPRRG